MELTKFQVEALATLVKEKIAGCEKRQTDVRNTYQDRADAMLLEHYDREIRFWDEIRQKVEEGL